MHPCLKKISRTPLLLWIGLFAFLQLQGCAVTPKSKPSENSLAYAVENPSNLIESMAPVFVINKSQHSYNRIGMPQARIDKNNKELISVNPESAAYFTQKLNFEVNDKTYTNLVYRVHFEKAPFSLIPFYLTAGKNVGLIVVITLNEKNQPLLLTTVHSCGCYLAFIPTNFLPDEAYPNNWNKVAQSVYGETLPGQIIYNEKLSSKPVIHVSHATHRINHVESKELEVIQSLFKIDNPKIFDMQYLKNLPLNEKTTSFFENSGYRKGYVKGTYKPFEMALVSWWALDFNVGVDKDFGDANETGTVFYTSLKPWQRKNSDMWPFEKFLQYWGWKF